MAGKKYDLIFSEEEKEEIRREYLEGCSIREICKQHSINCKIWVSKLVKDISRNVSDANRLAHKKYPERFRHTEETKAKIREHRLNYMKAHPEETAWRKRNEPSYPEKCFIKFLIENEYSKKYLIEREYPVFPFYIDFAFLPVKVAVEIDGSQHIKDPERVSKDEEKNSILLKNGWKVLRVSENLVKTDWVTLKNKLDEVIGNDNVSLERVGIFLAKKPREKVQRDKDGYSEKMREGFMKQRKIKNRPSLEEIEELQKTMSMVDIGKRFGVTDNAVRKWIKQYKRSCSSVGQ